MSMVKESIDVDCPIRQVYNQWTQFEDFPAFMDGVEDVRQIDATHNHWRTRIGGVEREFDTEIIDQQPDDRITWRAVSGDVQQMGTVSFQPLDDRHTRVSLAMDYQPQGMVEKAGELTGTVQRRIKGDLKHFKEFIEERGMETGGWRGQVRPGMGTTPSTGMGTPSAGTGMGSPSPGLGDPSTGMDNPPMGGTGQMPPSGI
ncbi:SRPBCC family protein [Streptacidiphilus monticola]|uniref:SRPBCC family protein n=1 Tax=Streptacidiphilus monticola TaxID=2161674 RepID=A0ABW1G7J7_9ACTN